MSTVAERTAHAMAEIEAARQGHRGADLGGADLGGADLRCADLRDANLRYADLGGAELGGADLRGADLGGADLRCANLRGADFRYANLRGANLWDADLRDADLRDADPILSVTGLPSGHAILTPTVSGWALRVGCWTGTIDGLRTLIAQDDGWPEAEGDQIAVRRPMLAALADMCEVWAADRQWALDAVIEKWGHSDGGAA
ncbi:pentapeptide repeat-containing protein [Gordonia sp. YC-JH1]|nr:pentapeptide repeat-containing protein [Gordonia sp. YC-JH1]